MNRIQALATTGFGQVVRFDHPGGEPHEDTRVEEPQEYAVSFVECGRFSMSEAAGRWEFFPGDMLLSYPGSRRSYRHGELIPTDTCLSVQFARDTVEEASGGQPARAGPPRMPASPRSLFLLHRLRQALEDKEPLALETRLLDLAPALAAPSGAWSGNLHRSGRFSHYLARATQACELLEAEYDHRHSLADLARRMAMSPYHFARVFKELVGRSPHRYLVEVRLAQAASRLRQGATVTDAGLISGFNELSHFIRLFKRRYGVSPGAYKRESRRAQGGAACGDDRASRAPWNGGGVLPRRQIGEAPSRACDSRGFWLE